MALSIKTPEADQLARSLAKLTGESMTTAVTIALRERLTRERQRRDAASSLPTRVSDLATRLRTAYNTAPVTHEEWDEAAGDQG